MTEKTPPSKTLSNRLRLAARRQQLVLERSKLRDPRAVGYGSWRLYDATTGTAVAVGLSLDGAEEYLLHGRAHQLALEVVVSENRAVAEDVAAEHGRRADVVATRLRENDEGTWRVVICRAGGGDRHPPVT